MIDCHRTVVVGKDHPREYGENIAANYGYVLALGSSPRIRGESPNQNGESVSYGIIPANTGRILDRQTQKQPRRDHPREYGENR